MENFENIAMSQQRSDEAVEADNSSELPTLQQPVRTFSDRKLLKVDVPNPAGERGSAWITAEVTLYEELPGDRGMARWTTERPCGRG